MHWVLEAHATTAHVGMENVVVAASHLVNTSPPPPPISAEADRWLLIIVNSMRRPSEESLIS